MFAELELRHVAALVVGAVACLFDLRTRRIPNALTLGAAAAAIVYAFLTGGTPAVLTSVGGWLTGCASFLPVFLLGGMGAGDVKLIAAIGAWLGPTETFWAVIATAILGGVMALLLALATGYLRRALENTFLLVTHWWNFGVRPVPEVTLAEGHGPRLPYAFAIAAGTLAAIWMSR
jgi:prepilin peptidase CpaA